MTAARMIASRSILFTAACLFCSQYSSGAIVFFGDRASFHSANPGLATETFENSSLSAGQVVFVEAFISSSSNNSAFLPGDILPGIAIGTFPGASGDIMPVVGPGVITGTSTMVGSQNQQITNFQMDLIFSNGTHAAAADLFAADSPGDSEASTFSVSVFDRNQNVIGQTQIDLAAVEGGFLGVSSSDPIGRIRLSSTGATEFVDNISFQATAVPEPSSWTIAVLAFVALSLMARKSWRSKMDRTPSRC